MARHFTVPEGARLEITDIAALARWEKQQARSSGMHFVHGLESRWLWVGAAVCSLLAFMAAGYAWGLPIAAKFIAFKLPPKINEVTTDQARTAFVHLMSFEDSKLAADKRAVALDFQGVLASGLAPQDYPTDPSLPVTSMGFPAVKDFADTQGAKAITVPGAVAGCDHALTRYGSKTLAETLQPAIALAESGIPASWFCTLMIASEMAILAKDPVSSLIYLPGGAPLQPGETLKIPGLANTLRRIAEHWAK